MLNQYLSFFLLFCVSFAAPAARAEAIDDSSSWRLRGDLFLSGSWTRVKESQNLNLGNRALEVPSNLLAAEIRPDLKWQPVNEHFFVLRSSHDYRMGKIEFQMPAQTQTVSEGKSDLTDFYVSSDWNETMGTVIGLQNYQWGPGELFSPTNPFFHFQPDQKKFFFKEKGKVLARMNWSISDQFTLIALAEILDNRQAVWMAETDFEQKSLVKIDYQFTNPVNSIAFIYGQEGQRIFFSGVHGAYALVEGLSVYLDAKFSQGRKVYVPQKTILGIYDMEKTDDQSVYGTSLIGVRFEDRVDFRQEFLFHDPGYTEDEWKNAKKSATTLSLNLQKNLNRFYKPGLEFKRKAYSYTSLRIPNLGSKDDITVFARLINSLSEESRVYQMAYEHNLTEAMVGSVEYTRSAGAEDSEFNLWTDDQFSAGLRYAF